LGHETVTEKSIIMKLEEAPMATLTAELGQEIEKAGGNPIRLQDPETNAAYVLLKA
jgi:hypothetical protein